MCGNRVDALGSGLGVRTRPDRGDDEQRVGEAVEHQQHGRPDEDHVRHTDRALRRTGQFLDQSHRFVAEITYEAGERARQRGRHVHPAVGDQAAQRRQRIGLQCGEPFAIGEPMPVQLALRAGRTEHKVRREADQAVASTHGAALDRLQQEVAAARLDQLERGGDRRFGIRDLLAPDQRGAPGRKGGTGGVETLDHGLVHWPPLRCRSARRRAIAASLRRTFSALTTEFANWR